MYYVLLGYALTTKPTDRQNKENVFFFFFLLNLTYIILLFLFPIPFTTSKEPTKNANPEVKSVEIPVSISF